MDQQYVHTHTPCKTYTVLQQSVMRNNLANCGAERKGVQKVVPLMLVMGSSRSPSTGMRYSKESRLVTKPWPAKYTNASTPVASLPAAPFGERQQREEGWKGRGVAGDVGMRGRKGKRESEEKRQKVRKEK